MASVQIQNPDLIDFCRPYFFPNSDLEMWERLTTYHYGGVAAVNDHFRGSALLAGWNWAAAPFVVPTFSLADSILTVSFAAANRAFLYQSVPEIAINNSDKLASVSLLANTVDFGAGLRLDDGSDNNYVEVVLRVSQVSPTQWAVQGRSRIGGGAVNTVNGDALDAPLAYVLLMNVYGQMWNGWGIYPHLKTPMGHHAEMFKPAADPAGGAAVWTPTRVGLIFDNVAGGKAWEKAFVDWCILD